MSDGFTIADVARIHGVQVLRENKAGGETFAVCPFCGAKRGFTYIVQKGNKRNIYHCFKCEEGGGSIDLHMKLSGKSYTGPDARKEAARDIYRMLNGDVQYHARPKFIPTVTEAEKASDEHCSTVYRKMLKLLKLEDRHREDLRRRGLTDEQIDTYLFRSTPRDTRRLCRRLIEQKCDLEGVPGFYKEKRGNWNLSIPGAGYLCPVYDGERNLLCGFQIRVDNPKNGVKYLWLSSAGKQSGVSSGAVSTYLPGENDNIIIITEGILKAIVIYLLLNKQVTVIGVPGVNSIQGIRPYLASYDGKAFVVEAYDMDKAIRTEDEKLALKTERIAAAKDKLTELVQEYHCPVHPLKWDMDEDGYWKGEYKGLDDFLVSYDEKKKFVGYLERMSQKKRKLLTFFHDTQLCKEQVS